jgi:arylsulfatase A-like enzyme
MTVTVGITSLILRYQIPRAEQPPVEPPNILFAIADDWGWPHSPLYGDKVVKTPTLEKIAGNGILFTNAYVSAPSCTPSRNAILTGQYHWRLGPGASLYSQFPENHTTFPNLLEDNGYFVGSYRKAFGPGKDRPRPVAGKKYQSVEAFFRARPPDRPFCFWFGASDPHRKYVVNSGVESGMKPEDVQVPPCLPDAPEVRKDICDYYWEVQRFDREVGELLDLLEETGDLDNTIVVMTGDHGWPFPRGKGNLYDLGTRVPLAIQWPNKIKKGRVVDDFISFTDFAPTFLEAAGLPLVPAMTGRSMMHVFASDKDGLVDPGRDHVLTGKERHTPAQPDNMGGTPMRAIRNQDFLYIHNFEPDRWPAGGPTSQWGPAYADIDNGPTKSYILAHKDEPGMQRFFDLCCGKRPRDELYDIRTDPYQLNNVADNPAYAAMLTRLKEQLFEELAASNDPRVLGEEEQFDAYPYLGNMRNKK